MKNLYDVRGNFRQIGLSLSKKSNKVFIWDVFIDWLDKLLFSDSQIKSYHYRKAIAPVNDCLGLNLSLIKDTDSKLHAIKYQTKCMNIVHVILFYICFDFHSNPANKWVNKTHTHTHTWSHVNVNAALTNEKATYFLICVERPTIRVSVTIRKRKLTALFILR